MNENNKQIEAIEFKLPSDLKIKERARRILAVRFEHPEYTHKQIGGVVGVSPQRVQQILSHPRVLEALPVLSRQHIRAAIPKATKAYTDLLTHENAIVKERAAAKILTDQKVFDAVETKSVVEITLKSVQELQAIVQKASELPRSVIDAEIVSDSQDLPT